MALRLAFFDVDGTLKQENDPYVYLHRHLGTEKAGLALIEAFLAGQIDYDTFSERDTALWTGVPIERIDQLLAAVPYIPETVALLDKLREAGVKIVLISTGIDRHVAQVAADVGAAAWYANEVVERGGHATGQMRVHVHFDAKSKIVRKVMAEHGAGPDECLAVGDGLGDLSMFAEVGHRIAVNPHEKVRREADFVLGEGDAMAWLAARGCISVGGDCD
jgi:phosphoserine phosphatase